MKRSMLITIVIGILILGGGTAMVLTRAQFLRTIADEVRRHLVSDRPDLSDTKLRVSSQIVAAMWALESGYGRSKAFREGWNGGNVSRGSWKGPTIAGGDLEYDAAGNVKRIGQQWRRYATLAEAVSDWFGLVTRGRYATERVVPALASGDAGAFVAALRRAGYYTAPEAEYLAGVQSALKGFA